MIRKDEKKPSPIKAMLTLAGLTVYIIAAVRSLAFMIKAIKIMGDVRSVIDIFILVIVGSLLLKISE